ncbi:DoxX family protein [Spirillospora sp. NPDC047279]|uniref:DoxX family protein n=1 Tax=Spirillospora sp. NPDC047279 TaxID=3155478 RepID=UPI00340EA0B5
MDVIALIARILFAFIFLGSAFGHLTNAEAMAGYAAGKKLPQPKLAVQFSGVWIGVAAVLLILGVWPDLAALMLLVFLLATAFLFHAFWSETSPEGKQQEQIQFSKDVSLAGGALGFFVLYAAETHPGLNLVGPLFSLS